jgi:hypothetical protein
MFKFIIMRKKLIGKIKKNNKNNIKITYVEYG